jgi:hypothetical protein
MFAAPKADHGAGWPLKVNIVLNLQIIEPIAFHLLTRKGKELQPPSCSSLVLCYAYLQGKQGRPAADKNVCFHPELAQNISKGYYPFKDD